MSNEEPVPLGLDDWIAREACGFSVDSPDSFNPVVDRMVGLLGDSVRLLGFGEALHGGDEILLLRNRLFERLVEAHGYTAIAVESSFPRGHAANEYVAGRGADSYDAIGEAGFSHGFGRLEANRELLGWMRRYNADPAGGVKIRFYGFDSPTEMVGSDSPRRLLHFVLDYFAAMGHGGAAEDRRRVDELIGSDADWENPGASYDPAKSIGKSPAAVALRAETEGLISELGLRRPDWGSGEGAGAYLEAMQHAAVARQLLNYHAALAEGSPDRIAKLLGIRDLMMADNLAYAVERERGRGKVLAFAHNAHLQRGKMRWQWGNDEIVWWPAGAHLKEAFGSRYAVIGSGVGASEANGIGRPEAGTIEDRLISRSCGDAWFIPTAPARGIQSIPTRSGSSMNQSYFPLSARSLTDFNGLVVLRATSYSRGGPPIPAK